MPSVWTAPNDQPAYPKSGQVAEILHVSRETVTRWAKAGRLPHHRTLGGHRVYSEAEIRALAATLVGPVR